MKSLIFILVAAMSVAIGAGELADLHKRLDRDGGVAPAVRNFEDMRAARHGVTEMGIERGGCFGRCPAYTFIVKSDGTFRYTGTAYVERVGSFTGKINKWQFDQLAWFVRDNGYMNLENKYALRVTDLSTVYTTAVINGRRKVISNYASAGPSKLWAVEQLIDGLLTKAEWSDAPKLAKPVSF